MAASWQAEDSDRTVIRPIAARACNRTEINEAWFHTSAPILTHPLIAAATPLLRLLAALADPVCQPEPQALRERAGREITRFEKRCREQGISMELVRPAHYALCAAIDDAVLRTAWGPASGWSERSLAVTRYRALHDDNQFFDMAAQLQRDPARFLPVLELFHLCLALGFTGRHADDPATLTRLRQQLATSIRHERAQAVGTPARSAAWLSRFGVFPAWLPPAAALLLIGGLSTWVWHDLNRAVDAVRAQANAAPPGHMPRLERIHPPEPLQLDRLKAALEVQFGSYLPIAADGAALAIRLPVQDAFAPNTATLRNEMGSVLERLGLALRYQPVTVLVLATAEPPRSGRPSDRTAAAWAQAVRAAVLRGLADPARIATDTIATDTPVAADTRIAERRIDILLRPEIRQTP